MPKASRRLVIDASVARSSGREDATYPISKHCRDFLMATLTICHRVVMTPDIMEEWHHHRSGFARTWLASMMARKKCAFVELPRDDNLRSKIERAAIGEQDRAAMLKDSHLIEAAMTTDQIVVSLDEAARGLFAQASQSVGELKSVTWVNPDRLDEQPIRWLENGAKSEKNRLLGSGM